MVVVPFYPLKLAVAEACPPDTVNIVVVFCVNCKSGATSESSEDTDCALTHKNDVHNSSMDTKTAMAFFHIKNHLFLCDSSGCNLPFHKL